MLRLLWDASIHRVSVFMLNDAHLHWFGFGGSDHVNGNSQQLYNTHILFYFHFISIKHPTQRVRAKPSQKHQTGRDDGRRENRMKIKYF